MSAICPECTGHSGQHAFGCNRGFKALSAHFQPSSPVWLTPQALLDVIATEVRVMGEQQIVAGALGVSPQYLCDVLNGRREPGAKLLKGLGYRRVVVYERVGDK